MTILPPQTLNIQQRYKASKMGIALCFIVIFSICFKYEGEWFEYLRCKGECEILEVEIIDVKTEKVGERSWMDYTVVRSKEHGDAKIPSDLRDKPGKIIKLGATKENYVVRLSPVIPPLMESMLLCLVFVSFIFFIIQFFRLRSKCKLEEAQEQAKEYAQMSQSAIVQANKDFINFNNTANQNDYQNQNYFTDQNDYLNQNDSSDIYKS